MHSGYFHHISPWRYFSPGKICVKPGHLGGTALILINQKNMVHHIDAYLKFKGIVYFYRIVVNMKVIDSVYYENKSYNSTGHS